MNDTELMSLWSALEPNGRQCARIETRVLDWLESSANTIAPPMGGLL